MSKKQGKKFLAAVLSYCLILSMMITYAPVNVNAAGNTGDLKFSAEDLSHGKIFVKIGDDTRIQIDASEADPSGTIWKHNIDANDQTVVITAEPDEGYEVSDISVYEGEESETAAFGGEFDKSTATYSFPLKAFTYVVGVAFEEVGSAGPEENTTASLKFDRSDLEELKLTYKIDLSADAVIPEGDETSYGVVTEVDGANADGGGAIWIRDFVCGGQVTITAELKAGVEGKLSDKVDQIYANEGEEGRCPAYGGFFTFNEDETVCSYSFDVNAMDYEVRIVYAEGGPEGPGENPGGDPGENPGQRPENYEARGFISMSTHGDVSGNVSYLFMASGSDIASQEWNIVSVEGSYYEPIDMSNQEGENELFLRIEGGNGKHLDADGDLIISRIVDGHPERIYRIGGSFNDDPNYDEERDGKQLDGIGLCDLYDNELDCYIIPFDYEEYKTDAISMEFHWKEVTTIDVEVDEASQYMLASGKAEIGIATGKGFKTKVEDNSHVSIPVLEDMAFDGEGERYLIDIKIKREYFVPEFTFNGKSYETFEVGFIDGTSAGTDEYAYIATAVPASEFKQLIEEAADNKLVIHLTVDKSVGVVDSSGEESDVQAAFRLIDDGDIPEEASMEELDAEMALEANLSDISIDERGAGYLESYDITMELEGANATEFPVPINILLPGEYDDDSQLVVVREHEGEEAEELECVVENGNVIFSTDKFSRFSVKGTHVHSGTKVNQVNATCVKYGVKSYYKCSCGKYYSDSACTKEITDLEAWKSGDGRIEKKEHTGGKATCKVKAKCSVCGEEYGSLAAHTYATKWSSDGTNHWHACSVCGDKKDSAVHTLKTTTTKATLTANGKKETKCSVCGKVTKTETIYAAKTIKLSATKYTYDGKVKKPSVTIKDSKGNAIASTNYTVTYPSGRKNVGKYTVKVTFKGNYSGTKNLTFTINPPKTSISKLTAGKKAFTVKWAKKTTQVTGYEIQYSTSSTFAKGNKTVKVTSAKTASKTISKLTGGKKYYVRIRTYKTVGKTPYYSDWSAKKSVTTKK